MNKIAMVVAMMCITEFAASGCTPGPYLVGTARFSSKDEALSVSRKYQDAMVRGIRPLADPIAESIVVVTPTIEASRSLARVQAPQGPEEAITYLAEAGMMSRDAWMEIIQARNMFRVVNSLHADNIDMVDIPPRGYLLWLQVPDHTQVYWHIAAKGEDRTSQLVIPDWSAAPPAEQNEAFLEVLQDYVTAHPAQP